MKGTSIEMACSCCFCQNHICRVVNMITFREIAEGVGVKSTLTVNMASSILN